MEGFAQMLALQVQGRAEHGSLELAKVKLAVLIGVQHLK